jgi:hypothetical protein
MVGDARLVRLAGAWEGVSSATLKLDQIAALSLTFPTPQILRHLKSSRKSCIVQFIYSTSKILVSIETGVK